MMLQKKPDNKHKTRQTLLTRARRAVAEITKRCLSERLVARIRWIEDVIDTEYHYRFSRGTVQRRADEFRKLPPFLHIEATNVCNAKCVFCAYPQMQRAKESMPIEDFKRIVSEYLDLGGQRISLTPIVGDPFVDRHFFERVQWLYEDPRVNEITFYTNGILMKPETTDRLLQYADKLDVHISWGGWDRESYKVYMGVDQFDQAYRNVAYLIERKLEIGSSVSVSMAVRSPKSLDCGELHDRFWKWHKEGHLGWERDLTYDNWAGKIAPETLEAVDLIPRLMPIKRGPCVLLYTRPMILANGKVNACNCRDVEAELIVGDLNETPLSEVWDGRAHQELIDAHERGDFPDVCKRCSLYVSIYNSHRSRFMKLRLK